MKQLFHGAMKAGAFGISADMNMEDRPEDGGFLPSQVASDEEYLALADVLGEFGVGHYGWTIGVGHEPDECRRQEALLTEIMKRSGRPLHVILGDLEGFKWVDASRAEGLPVVVQVQPVGSDAEFKLDEYNLFDYMPNWVQPFVGTREERSVKLRGPQ